MPSQRERAHRSRWQDRVMSATESDAADESPAGRTGTLLVGTRGMGGPGEVQVSIRGGRETYRAYSDEPIAAGEAVLIIESLPHRCVTVVAWIDPFAQSVS
jgi:hypothetical protein